jgi:serine/threonine protein kinase
MRAVCPSLNLICESVAMTSQSDPESTTPQPDRDDSPDESAEQQTVPAVESDVAESDAEATIAGPHASVHPADERTVVDDHGTVLPVSNTDVDPEMTLAEKLEDVLEEFAQTLAPEHQDLNRTLSETSLKSAVDSESHQRSRHESFSQSRSVRPRSIQPADSTIVDAGSAASADTKSPDRELDYVTLNKLGEGGIGTVHLARQIALGREVALKQIHQQSSRRQSVRDEFLTEAALTGKLEHPNIVPIYEVGESASGELFYSMKNVKGLAWDQTIDDLTLDQNLEILIDVCDAIAFAHEKGVTHRDLKPQNIMTGGFGEVLVLDWGLAVPGVPGADVKASPGGTPGYMAPEMVNPPFLVGPRSDVYLLGAILFRFLTGKAPHAGKSAREAMISASKNEIDDAGPIQGQERIGAFLEVALQAMATAPADRFQTAGDFQQAVRAVDLRRDARRLNRIKRLKKIGIGLVVSILVIVFGATYAVNKQRKETVKQRLITVESKKEARRQKGLAKEQKVISMVNEQKAVVARNDAVVAQKQEAKQRELAENAKDAALIAQKKEAVQRQLAEANEKKAKESEMKAVISRNAAVESQKEEAQQKLIALAAKEAAEQRLLAVKAKYEAEAALSERSLLIAELLLAEREPTREQAEWMREIVRRYPRQRFSIRLESILKAIPEDDSGKSKQD